MLVTLPRVLPHHQGFRQSFSLSCVACVAYQTQVLPAAFSFLSGQVAQSSGRSLMIHLRTSLQFAGTPTQSFVQCTVLFFLSGSCLGCVASCNTYCGCICSPASTTQRRREVSNLVSSLYQVVTAEPKLFRFGQVAFNPLRVL